MNAKALKDRVREHRQAQKDKGLVEVRVWVPEGMADKIRELAAKLRGDSQN